MDEDELGVPEPESDPDERRLNIQMPAELVGGTYAVLGAVQAATVAARARQARRRGRSWVWLAVPALLLAAGVAIIDLVPRGPHALALLATFGTPVLAAAGGLFLGSRLWWLWPPASAGLWVAAWLAGGLLQDAAGFAPPPRPLPPRAGGGPPRRPPRRGRARAS